MSLLEVLDHLPGALYQWVIEQTMTALNDSVPASERDMRGPSADPGSDETLVLGEVIG